MKSYKLSDIFDIQIGKTPSRSKKEYWGDGSSWLSIRDLNNLEENKYILHSKEQITNSAISDTNIKIVPTKTLLYSFKLSIGKVAITKNPIYTNEAIAAFLQKKETPIDVDTDYIFYLLKSKDVSSLTHNAVKGKSLNKSKLNALIISLPSYEEQKRKANVLNQIQNLINRRTKTIELLDEYIKSVFLDMFGDPIENPKKWKKFKINVLCESIVSGRNKPKKFNGSIPWIKTPNMNNLGFVSIDNDYLLTREEVRNSKNKIVPSNSVIMTSTGSIGVVSINKNEIVLNQQLHAYQCKKELLPEFLMFVLNAQKKYIISLADQAIIKYLNKTKCESLDIILPKISIQKIFANLFKRVLIQKEQNQKSLKLLEELFQSVLYQTFHKKQEIKEDEIDKLINDELEIDILLADIKNPEMFETLTQYDISRRKLFNVLERTEFRIKETKEKKKPFSKGLIQKLSKGNIGIDYNEPFKLVKDEIS